MLTLPSEVVLHVLQYVAFVSPSAALSVCLVCRSAYPVGKRALDSHITIRSRQDLVSIVSELSSRKSVLSIFVNNRDSTVSSGQQNRSISVLQAPLRAALSHGPDPTHEHVELVQALVKQEPSQVLEALLSRFRHVEYLFFWEPFSINYPPEISESGHISAYPLDTYLAAHELDAPQSHPALDSSSNPRSRVALLKELTMSYLALRPRQFAHTVPGPTGSLLAFSNLTHLHLHWPALTGELADSLASLPALAHVRLSRPRPDGLVDGITKWLSLSSPFARRPDAPAALDYKFHRLVVELGLYLDDLLIQDLVLLEQASRVTLGASTFHRLLLLERNRDRTKYSGQWLQFDQASSWREWRDRLEGRSACWITPCYCQSLPAQ
ncbi:hypothetical protein BCV70DRAFT_197036 [Testicularia cyperi]|uniref:F-box domain-containing protein n=1 Tax=Testicularia cyperi TaxID=1882483 RepID=A0A317XWT0_9BASI|nr:hypothetical protein BCV70DRAFT_197036 [Testicularia cyperi]